MKKQPFVNFILCGMSLTEFGLEIPSPFCSLELTNSEIDSFTSWTLRITVGGDASRKVNIATFEALLYSAAQSSSKYDSSSGIPVSFMFGWLNEEGAVSEYLSYQGFTLKFSVSTTGLWLVYEVTGYASLSLKSSMPVLNIPAVSGYVQPSAVVEAVAKGIKADDYYDLDIDHCDSPTLVSHSAMTTSFSSYVKGNRTGQDDYGSFPGLLTLSKVFNSTRQAAGLKRGVKRLSTLVNALPAVKIANYLKQSITDNTPQCSSFAFWIDEPTMTKKGVIHYKSKASIMTAHEGNTLEYGTANTNILSLSGSYNGIAYNMSDMNFANLGFSLDGSGNTIANSATVVNSWSSSVANVFQTVNIINDINALATQFSGKFDVQIPGSVKQYGVCEPISLVVMNGNTLSPVTGVYSITSVTHSLSNTFVTTLKLQRLVMSSASQTATSNNIYVSGTQGTYGTTTYKTTPNVISTGKVDFGTMYPTFRDIITC